MWPPNIHSAFKRKRNTVNGKPFNPVITPDQVPHGTTTAIHAHTPPPFWKWVQNVRTSASNFAITCQTICEQNSWGRRWRGGWGEGGSKTENQIWKRKGCKARTAWKWECETPKSPRYFAFCFEPSLLPFLPFFLSSFPSSFLPSLFLSSFLLRFFLSSFPSLFPSFLPPFLPSFLPSFLHPFLSSFLPSFVASFLPSLLPSFLASFLLASTPETETRETSQNWCRNKSPKRLDCFECWQTMLCKLVQAIRSGGRSNWYLKASHPKNAKTIPANLLRCWSLACNATTSEDFHPCLLAGEVARLPVDWVCSQQCHPTMCTNTFRGKGPWK